jgi:hypothetical protein
MNNLITTLVIEALDSNMSNQAGATATTVANAVSSNRIAIQTEGVFRAGDYTSTGATDLIKLSAATLMADGSISVMSSSEFLKKDIISSHYAAAIAPATTNSSIDFSSSTKLGGQYFVRVERKDGSGINDSETFSGETVAQIVTAFNKRKGDGLTEFANLALTDLGSNVLNIAVAARDTGSALSISANDGATVTRVFPANNKGSLTVAKGLEKSGFISMGAYNQYGFPIVVPETSTGAGQDYGIYTLELKKKVGGRFVYETIKVLIADDEASVQKTVKAIENVCGLSSADLTVPTAITSTTFVTAINGVTGAGSTYTAGIAVPIFVKAVGLEVGATVTFTLETNGTQPDVTQSFTAATTTQTFAITVADSADYTATKTLTAQAVQADSNNNVSAATTTANAVTIAS